jgi:hypothetical protein
MCIPSHNRHHVPCSCCMLSLYALVVCSRWAVQDSLVEAAHKEGGKGEATLLLHADLRVTSGMLELLDGRRRRLIVAQFDGTQHATMWTNDSWEADTNLRHFTVSDHTQLRQDTSSQDGGGGMAYNDSVDADEAENEAEDATKALALDEQILMLDMQMLPVHTRALQDRLMIFPRNIHAVSPTTAQAEPQALAQMQLQAGVAPLVGEPSMPIHAAHRSTDTSDANSYMLTLRISAKPESNNSHDDTANPGGGAAASRTLAYDIGLRMVPYNVFLRRRVVDRLVAAFTPPEQLKWHTAARKRAAVERATAWRVALHGPQESEGGRRSEGWRDSEGMERHESSHHTAGHSAGHTAGHTAGHSAHDTGEGRGKRSSPSPAAHSPVRSSTATKSKKRRHSLQQVMLVLETALPAAGNVGTALPAAGNVGTRDGTPCSR